MNYRVNRQRDVSRARVRVATAESSSTVRHFYFFSGMMAIVLILILMVLSGCQSSSLTDLRGGEEFEGWRVEDDRDVFYMRLAGSASENAREKNDQSMMRTTCIESTNVQAADRVIRKMLGETINAESGMFDGQTTNYIVNSVRSGLIRGTNQKECSSRGRGGSWEQCECIHTVSGRNLRRNFELEVRNLTEEL